MPRSPAVWKHPSPPAQPSRHTHTASTGRPAAMSVTTEGVGTGSVGRLTRLGCLMWSRYTEQSSN